MRARVTQWVTFTYTQERCRTPEGTMQGPAATAGSELSFLWLEITSRCNLECAHCYADAGPSKPLQGTLALADWQVVIRDAAALGCRSVQFIGGEPTLHPDLLAMIDTASTHGFAFIEVYTNATGLSERMVAGFAEHRVHVATSFYSDDPRVHDSMTGRAGSFAKTTRTIRRIAQAGLPVRAGIIEGDANRGHAQAAVRQLRALGVTEYGIDAVRPVGRGAHASDQPSGFDALCGQCSKGRLCVTAPGDVYPCVFSRAFPLGRIEQGLASLLRGQPLVQFRAAQQRFEEARAATRLAGHECRPTCSPGDLFCEPMHSCMPQVAPNRPPGSGRDEG
jgi:MoaA/NifB/PqqE/SkfB family radical SAM enzyme